MKQVRRKLFEWIDAIPVYGFNSSGYDINVFRKLLPKVLSKFQKHHGNISKAEKEWILSLNQKWNRNLVENHRILKYNVDGYDSETKIGMNSIVTWIMNNAKATIDGRCSRPRGIQADYLW
jgi:hypothetical protein